MINILLEKKTNFNNMVYTIFLSANLIRKEVQWPDFYVQTKGVYVG